MTLLSRIDSLAALADTVASMQMQQGTATAGHRATAQLYRASVSAELIAARTHYRAEVSLFNRALGEPTDRYLPDDSLFEQLPQLLVPLDTTHHPLIEQARARLDHACSQRDLVSASLLPSVLVGYNSTTLIGYQNVTGVERYFGNETRFGSVRVGLSVPLPTPWTMAALGAADAQITRAEWEHRSVSWELERMRLEARALREAAATSVTTFERQSLHAASTLEQVASVELANRNLDAYQWALALDRALTVERAYLDARRRLIHPSIQSELLGDLQ